MIRKYKRIVRGIVVRFPTLRSIVGSRYDGSDARGCSAAVSVVPG